MDDRTPKHLVTESREGFDEGKRVLDGFGETESKKIGGRRTNFRAKREMGVGVDKEN